MNRLMYIAMWYMMKALSLLTVGEILLITAPVSQHVRTIS